ncbi:MAG: metallophosphoesterase [Deltaproteobacteria bacterium]|nr:metallophosphoesterase [Deltaproteobacteria bacterium]
MTLFLLIYFGIYGGAHLYAFLKLKRGFAIGLPAYSILAIFMILMVAAPILVRIFERHGYEAFARGLAYVGFTWMGLLFIFISVSFFFDIYRLLHFLATLLTRSPLADVSLSHRTFCTLAILLSFAVVIYGYFEALDIRTEHVTVKTSKIPEKIGRFRVVQISDVHLGLIVGKSRLKRILRKVEDARPDILVSTGDLVDGQMDDLEALTDMFQNIPTTYGKFAITGNHEFYAGLDRALAFTEKAGFTMLRGEGMTVADLLNVAGVDDPARKRYYPDRAASEKALLEKMPGEKFTLFLKHQPVISAESLGRFDLQLSGHTHKGQIFPFNLVTKFYYPMHTGLSEVGENALLYVSRGSGTWGPPFRFLSPPEVTVIDVTHKSIQ